MEIRTYRAQKSKRIIRLPLNKIKAPSKLSRKVSIFSDCETIEYDESHVKIG